MAHPALARALAACAGNLFARSRLNSDGTIGSFSFGPPGMLLLDNVFREWRLNCVLDAPHEIFPFSGDERDLGDAVVDAQKLHPLPFGVAHSWVETAPSVDEISCTSSAKGAGCTLFPAQRQVLCASVLVPTELADRAFHDWQQHRAIWWRKLSSDPGRYGTRPLPEPNSIGIGAKFAWGTETVETVTLRPAPLDLSRARPGLSIVRSETSLEAAALAFLCDAIDETHGTRLHRKLAPYKIGFIATAEETALTQLARFLCRQLRQTGTSCLLAPQNFSDLRGCLQIAEPELPLAETKEPASEWLRARLNLHDALGVPFTLILSPDSLRTGVASLRSRDSTLQEQIHVTDLKTYVELLLKNY